MVSFDQSLVFIFTCRSSFLVCYLHFFFFFYQRACLNYLHAWYPFPLQIGILLHFLVFFGSELGLQEHSGFAHQPVWRDLCLWLTSETRWCLIAYSPAQPRIAYCCFLLKLLPALPGPHYQALLRYVPSPFWGHCPLLTSGPSRHWVLASTSQISSETLPSEPSRACLVLGFWVSPGWSIPPLASFQLLSTKPSWVFLGPSQDGSYCVQTHSLCAC